MLKSFWSLIVMTIKCAVLAIVLLKFRMSWVGLSVALGMAILLFRLDRRFVRFATGALGARR